MKKLILMATALACFAVAPNASAQELSKKEYKQWKKQMKSMEVEEFKQMVEEKEGLETQVSSLNSEISSVQARLSDKNAEVAQLESQIKDLENKVAEMQTMEPEEGEIDGTGGKATRVAKGVVFKVQIGAFRNKELAKYFDNNGSFDGEVDNSLERYTLGIFTDYWEADKFKKYLREMGVKDAWIVSYKDGTRVPLKDVL